MKKLKVLGIYITIFTFLVSIGAPLVTYADTATTNTTNSSTTSDAANSLFYQKLDLIMQQIKANYYKDITDAELQEAAIKGMFEALDKHSVFFNAEEYQTFMNSLQGEIIGIGVTLEQNENGGLTVVSPIKGGEAEKVGIKTGDIIVSVDGTDISKITLEKAIPMIRGKEDTIVKIGVIREGSKVPMVFTITRKVVKLEIVKYKILENNIGYIQITQFTDGVTAEVNKAVAYMQDKNVKGVIFDLRGNPGGYLNEVISLCQELVPAGPIVHSQRKGEIMELGTSTLTTPPFKIVALVDKGSASASEIMAGAIKDSGVGILVGDTTYGKGTVQSIFAFSNGEGDKITIENYLTRNKFALDGVGITPNVIVKFNLADFLSGFSPMPTEKTLKKGDVSLAVQGLQQRLKFLGYQIKADGVYTTDTVSVVKAFQKGYKLKIDGVMDSTDLNTVSKVFKEKLKGYDPQLNRAKIEIVKLLDKK